jgi:hypothetical protein
LQIRKRGAPDEGSVPENPVVLSRRLRCGHTRSLARHREIRAVRWTR